MQYMRPVRLWFIILLLSGLLPCGSHSLLPVPECRSAELSNLPDIGNLNSEPDLEQELLQLTNQQRIQQGLQPLALDSSLIQIAREHSRGMAQQGFISHEQPSGDLKVRMQRAGYLYQVARENVASALTISKAQSALIESLPHKSNILAQDVSRVGIGIARLQPPLDKHLYITEIFAAPRNESMASLHGR
jgi:uncharacterized protein YkwD